MRPVQAFGGTLVRRRELRSAIRNVLGTSRDAAPGAYVALRAAHYLDQLLLNATAGEFRIAVKKRRGSGWAAVAETLTPQEATKQVRERGET
jgi:hypothetical protein